MMVKVESAPYVIEKLKHIQAKVEIFQTFKVDLDSEYVYI